MAYTFSKIAEILNGEALQIKSDAAINQLALDSRLPLALDCFFVAIKGKHHNSHKFCEEIYKRGVRNFLVSEKVDLAKMPEANVLWVEDSVHALQTLAKQHRKQFQYPVIGITGSNGKTIIKEWLNVLLSDQFSIIRSPRSYNSQVGVPLSIWQMDSHHNLAIIEAGISEKGEMESLQKMIRPSIGLLSNIGEAHQAGFTNYQEKTLEKLTLFKGVETLIYRKSAYGIEDLLGEAGVSKAISWSTTTEAKADYSVKIKRQDKISSVEFVWGESLEQFLVPFIDEASIENAIHCIVMCLFLGLGVDTIQERLNDLVPLAMRLEMIQGYDNCTILNDAYNSDIHSLEIALATLDRQVSKKKKTIILSDIEQSGKTPEKLHKELVRLLTAHKVDRFIGIGQYLKSATNRFTNIDEVLMFENTNDFLKELSVSQFSNEAILVKGARKYGFEKIVNHLVQKKRQTVLEVNLNRVQENLNYYQSLIQPSTKLMVMVKALSYGAGSIEISKLLQYNKVDYLCVAYADEGVELRLAGIHLPIMVLNSNADEFSVLAKYSLEPVVYSLTQLSSLENFLSLQGEIDFRVHLELDTGMHRLGFVQSDLPELKTSLKKMSSLEVQSIFSHLSSSDDPASESFTRAQFGLFDKMYADLASVFRNKPLKHILNTAGIENFPEQQCDMVRLGIGLYGISNRKNNRLKSVSTLKTYIAQIKQLKAGESIGYNRSEKLKQDSSIAIVNIGYGDGLPRKAGNRKYSFQIAGKPAPIIGNVCMDMCMVDLSTIPKAKVGDEVLVFGEDLPVEQLAEIGGTISYEILTGIAPRVKRLYLSE